MPNKFASSLKSLENNTSLENQGGNKEEQRSSVTEILTETPGSTEKETTLSEQSEVNKVPDKAEQQQPQPKAKKEASSMSASNVTDILEKLHTKGAKGKSINVYLSYTVLDELDKMCRERNVSRSSAISALLEDTFFK